MIADVIKSDKESSTARNNRAENKMKGKNSTAGKIPQNMTRHMPTSQAMHVDSVKSGPNIAKEFSFNQLIPSQGSHEAELISNFFKPATLIVPSKFKPNKQKI